jgi:hypothetical protein
MTFRFDHPPGYTPSEPDQAEYSLSRDCYSFAAIALSCLTRRIFDSDGDPIVALEEAVLPAKIRTILGRCLSGSASQRPPWPRSWQQILSAHTTKRREPPRRRWSAILSCLKE